MLNVRKDRYSALVKVIFRDLLVLVGESAIVLSLSSVSAIIRPDFDVNLPCFKNG